MFEIWQCETATWSKMGVRSRWWRGCRGVILHLDWFPLRHLLESGITKGKRIKTNNIKTSRSGRRAEWILHSLSKLKRPHQRHLRVGRVGTSADGVDEPCGLRCGFSQSSSGLQQDYLSLGCLSSSSNSCSSWERNMARSSGLHLDSDLVLAVRSWLAFNLLLLFNLSIVSNSLWPHRTAAR